MKKTLLNHITLLLVVFCVLNPAGTPFAASAPQGEFSAAELKRMGIFLSNFVEQGDFCFHAKELPAHPDWMNKFGIRHNFINIKSRVRQCAEKNCKWGSLVLEGKHVTEAVKKYFGVDYEPVNAEVQGDTPIPYHYDGKLFHFTMEHEFERYGGEAEWNKSNKVHARVDEAVLLPTGLIRMKGEAIVEKDKSLGGALTALARPHKYGGKDTWTLVSLWTEGRYVKNDAQALYGRSWPVINNGGYYVGYTVRNDVGDGSGESTLVYFRSLAGGSAKSGKVMRLHPDDTVTPLFDDDGYGPIFIHLDDRLGPRFVLNRRTAAADSQSYTLQFYTTDLQGGHKSAYRDGQVFALDQERDLVVGSAAGGEIFTFNLKNAERKVLAKANHQPLYYDPEYGVLYCADGSANVNTKPGGEIVRTLCSLAVADGKETLLFSQTDTKIAKIMKSKTIGWYTFENVRPQGAYVYANIAGYYGRSPTYFGCVRLRIGKDGAGYSLASFPGKREWFGEYRPFSYKSEGPYADPGDFIIYQDSKPPANYSGGDAGGFYIFYNNSQAQILSLEDLAGLGLPEGGYFHFGEKASTTLENAEFLDGNIFFRVVTEAHDEGAGGTVRVYRKSLQPWKPKLLFEAAYCIR